MKMVHEALKEYEDVLPPKLISEIEEKCPASKLKNVAKQVFEEYEDARIAPGESVGLIGAESIGEQGTQMTLDTFHFAGVAEMNITMGLPRAIEVFDGRKEISTPMMEIYLKSPHDKGKDIKTLAMKLKETCLEELAKEFLLDMSGLKITIVLDKERLSLLGLTPSAIIKAIEKGMRSINVKQGDEGIEVKLKSKDCVLKDLYALKEKLKEIYVSGVKGIKQVLPLRRHEEFIIVTAGSNLKKIFEIDFVDAERTTTNDIFEISNVLGIEAARQAIINELLKVIDTQGLSIDIRHIMLVADTMCSSGEIKGITRYGVVGEKASVLARASFETPIKHIMNAALVGERDPLNSVVENVMINQPIPVGTGVIGLFMNGEENGDGNRAKKAD